MSDEGRKRLKDLAHEVREREKITDEGRHKRGLVRAQRVTRYINEEATDTWRRMEGDGGELYEDLEHALVEYLYPEMTRPTPK